MEYIAVGLAGLLGAITRGYLGKILIFKDTVFPVNTLLINLTGSFILCFFLTITLEAVKINPTIRLAISTGFLGAYTTFSTFTLETVNLIKGSHLVLALIYVIISTFGGLVFAWLGIILARYIVNYNADFEEIKDIENK